MTQIAEFLFPTPAPRSLRGIVGWWERRRLAYNLTVGGAGLASVTYLTILSFLPGGHVLGGAGSPLFLLTVPALLYAIAANVFYSLGPTVELLAHWIWGRRVLPIGPALYRMGLTFSVGLTLFPALLITVVWVFAFIAMLA